ncbi:MAG: hypothetical protein Q4B26_00210 [Eubacteriales bacterium]|nr:hypothetical protein [Eubacteriales bacterium]
MQIKELRTLDFQGLSGDRRFMFDKINAYILPQGAGKSSLIHALQYAISGTKPEGEMVYQKSDRCAVGLITKDGESFIRQVYKDGKTTCYLNKGKTPSRSLDEKMTQVTGVAQKTMKAASSADVMKSLKPDAFGELILSYTSETLDRKRIKDYLKDELTASVEQLVDQGIPEDNFGIDAVNAFHKDILEKRKNLKKEIAIDEAVIKDARKQNRPQESISTLREKEKQLIGKQSEAAQYVKRKKDYEKAVVLKKRQAEEIAKLEKEINQIKAVKKDAAERNLLMEQLKKKRELLDQAKQVGNTAFATAKDTKKVLAGLETALCPLSKKLVCTTDKTAIREELEGILQNAVETVEKQKKVIIALDEEEKKLEEKIALFDQEQNQVQKKDLLLAQLKRVKEVDIRIPEVPVETNLATVEKELTEARTKIRIWESLDKAAKLEVELTHKKGLLESLEFLASAFDRKGIVYRRITEDYMTAFEGMVNHKADALHKGMNVRFITDHGVKMLLDVRGNGIYLDYASLSGGEKALYLYLVLDLLNALSGFRILILDEVNVMDPETFDSLISLVVKDLDEYDHVMIAGVTNRDFEEILSKHKICCKAV